MYFADLRTDLLNLLRDRIRNGELTERKLARLVGASQPHMHNALKGVREISPAMADRILKNLDLTIWDLIRRRDALTNAAAGSTPAVTVPVQATVSE